MTIERRLFLRTAAAALAASPWLAGAAEDKATPVAVTHDMSTMPAHWTGKEQIGMLLYPGFTAQSHAGRHVQGLHDASAFGTRAWGNHQGLNIMNRTHPIRRKLLASLNMRF